MAIELKTTKFKPEYAGKMNFYLSALDSLVKTDADKSSIGIILCKDKNSVQAEFALKDIHKPIGIADYELTQAIPKNLQSKLPTIEDFERELKEIDGEK